ncbi:hypothetical protein QJS10_CPA07g00112 [Acorus calamus]|uniref:DC1 domain-containing protein n=1 Tax=Acorus calamus TaxID=4465 RepID=A0AAV9EFY6_ACOCL|nr:hypothetical protein QJS10_CPA07g00112 [Acorus calamus]
MSKADIIHHPLHPHPLLKLNNPNPYLCDGCNVPATGVRYRCLSPTCDFDLHERCAIVPTTLPSATHPSHHPPLRLTDRPSDPTNRRRCDVCTGEIFRHRYACTACDFDAHVICAMLPAHVNHAADGLHHLALVRDDQRLPVVVACAVCGGACGKGGLRYGCGACGIYVHLECLNRPAVDARLSPGVARRSVMPQPGMYTPWFHYNDVHCYSHQGHPAPPQPRTSAPEWLEVAKTIVGVMSNITFGFDLLN